jgi:hypothetical protein
MAADSVLLEPAVSSPLFGACRLPFSTDGNGVEEDISSFAENATVLFPACSYKVSHSERAHFDMFMELAPNREPRSISLAVFIITTRWRSELVKEFGQ